VGIQDNPNYQNDIKAFCQTGSANCRTTGRQKEPSDGFPKTPLDFAMLYISNNLSVIPIKPGEKTPLIKWEKYQKERPSIAEVQKWFKDSNINIAIVCGKVSGNLVVIDFDEAELYEKFLKELDNELKDIIENTWLVKTGKGYHIYLRVDSDKPVKIGKFEKIDIKGEGGYVVAPPSLHPSGKRYEFIRFSLTTGHEIRIISEEQYNKLLSLLKNVTGVEEQPEMGNENENEGGEEAREKSETRGWRELSNKEILEIVEILKPVYKEGIRHRIILYLVGWLYKAGIKYESAEALVKAICDTYKDEECNVRLYAVRDTYGIGRPLRENVLKEKGKPFRTKDGLFTWITKKGGFSEEIVLGIIKRLEEILETPEPGASIVIERLNYEKETFAIANFRRCEVITAVKSKDQNGEEKLVFKDKIILGCPEALTAIISPFSQIIKFDLIWNIPDQKRKLVLENVTIDEILAYLRANGLVLKKNQAEDVLNAILNAMVRKELADIRTGFDAPGFYWLDGKLIANKVEVVKPSPQELKEALELLNELVNVWFSSVREQFMTALKLGLLMPFSFAIKQKYKSEKGFLPWLYIYGQRDTGKTTTAEIILYIFNIMNRQHELGVGEVNTEAKLGAVLASDTFPHIINEGASLFDKPNLNEIIKQAVEGLIARQRFESKSIIKEYPAFAPLIITANEFRITDEALSQKRLVVLRYPITARVSKEKIAEFREKVTNRLPKLGALGQFVEWYLLQHPEELSYDWLNLGKKLLEKAYEYAGIAPGFDLGMQYIDMEEADPRLDIVAVLWRKILEAYNKKVEVTYEEGNYTVVTNPLSILESVLESRAIDFMIKEKDEVRFTSRVLQILKDEGVTMDSMPAFAEIFADYGFQYAQRRVLGEKKKVVVVKYENLQKLFHDFFNSNENDEVSDISLN